MRPPAGSSGAKRHTHAEGETSEFVSTLSRGLLKTVAACGEAGQEIGSMIRFSLRCISDHEFEGWFRDGATFEAQQQAGEIACPECGDHQIEKALMAPAISRGKSAAPQLAPAQ